MHILTQRLRRSGNLYEWDERNLREIALHNVTVAEAIEALEGFTHDDLPYQDHGGEFRYPILGETAAGRILRVIWAEGQQGKIRIITAFNAEPLERRLYRNERRR